MDYIETKEIPEISGVKVSLERFNNCIKSISFADEEGKVMFVLNMDRYGDSIKCHIPKPPEKKMVYVVEGSVDGLIDVKKKFDSKIEAENFINRVDETLELGVKSSLTITEVEEEV